MDINKFFKLQELIEKGNYKTLDEVLKNDNIRLDTSENAIDGKFLTVSVFHIKGINRESKEKTQKEIYIVLEKYGGPKYLR